MSEKYEDLTTHLSDDLEPTIAGEAYIRNSLRWLDEHPDQVPGRTITERVKITDTEAYELYESARSFSLDDFKLALESIDGIETVDDPEPTNAESIDNLLTEFANLNASCGGEQGDHDLAEFLDAHGVRVSSDD